LDSVAYDLTAPLNLELAAGQHFFYTYGGDSVSFDVAADGTIDYDPALDGVLSGRGSSTLFIHGVSVTVDATALVGTYTALDYTSEDATASYQVNLLPGQHFVNTYGGDPVDFTVAADGAVSYDPALGGVVSGGANALSVHGVSVTVDATALPGTYTALDYDYEDASEPYQVNLLPGQHFVNT